MKTELLLQRASKESFDLDIWRLKMAVKIIGTGSYVPENVADNQFLSTIVDTDDEWISQRTGIKERHLSSGSRHWRTPESRQRSWI